MTFRAQALAEFDLPVAPQRIDELGAPLPGVECARIHAQGARFLLLCSTAPLGLAFETTLFELLAEARFPAPRPRRARGGSPVAAIKTGGATAGAACYPWPSGEAVAAADATVGQLLEVGRLLARLHQLGETHPASVSDPGDGLSLLSRAPAGAARDALHAVLVEPFPPLPGGAVHGCLGPLHALFMGERCSGVLPAGRASFGGLLLDVCAAALEWMLGAPAPLPPLRAVFSGYQAMRRLTREEISAVPHVLRHAAAREGARRLVLGAEDPAGPLRVVETLARAELQAAAGG